MRCRRPAGAETVTDRSCWQKLFVELVRAVGLFRQPDFRAQPAWRQIGRAQRAAMGLDGAARDGEAESDAARLGAAKNARRRY
jgi:hypothetical protein